MGKRKIIRGGWCMSCRTRHRATTPHDEALPPSRRRDREYVQDPRLERVIQSAYDHDQDEPEMGFGDLESALRVLWSHASEEARAAAVAEIWDMVDPWEPGEVDGGRA